MLGKIPGSDLASSTSSLSRTEEDWIESNGGKGYAVDGVTIPPVVHAQGSEGRLSVQP